MGDIINLPKAGEPSRRTGEGAGAKGRKTWLQDGCPPGQQNAALGAHTMWAANHEISESDSWAIWRAIMKNPGSGPHKRGWTLDTYEYEKHQGSYSSAVTKTRREAVEHDESWSAIRMDEIDPQGLPLGEAGPEGILYDHGLYWLYGNSGDGKTVLAYYIAIARARAGHTIAVLDDEMGPNSSARLFRDLGASTGDMKGIVYLQWLDGDTPNLIASGASLSVFLDYIEADMVILDCMNAYLSAADLSDNSSNDIRKMLQAAVYPSRRAERAVLVIDHKGHAKEESRVRGSSDKMPGCDMMIGLDCTEPFQENQSGSVTLTCDKDRNAKVKGKELDIEMRVEGRDIRPVAGEWRTAEITPIRSSSKPGRKAKSIGVIADVLVDGPMTITEIAEGTGLTYDAVRKALSRDDDANFIKMPDGRFDLL